MHRVCTGAALEKVFERVTRGEPGARLAAFVSASGSSGTLAAGDHLKARHGAKIVVAEATECPTLLENGFGEHNIQGIGDKHVPYIHNVMNTDVVAGVSDTDTDRLVVLFNTETGRNYLTERRGVDPALVARLANLGLSSLCNMLAAIKTAKYFDLGRDDVIVTVATDGADMYGSESRQGGAARLRQPLRHGGGRRDLGPFARRHRTDHFLDMTYVDKKRVFNLGYFTWVEQQGVSVEEFTARRDAVVLGRPRGSGARLGRVDRRVQCQERRGPRLGALASASLEEYWHSRNAAHSLSPFGERVGVRGGSDLSIRRNPLTPTLSHSGRGSNPSLGKVAAFTRTAHVLELPSWCNSVVMGAVRWWTPRRCGVSMSQCRRGGR